MKTIIDEHNCSKYLFADDVVLNFKDDCIEVGDPLKLIIGDLNSNNSSVIEGVTEPEDWYGCKYEYIDDWQLCPDWVDPRIIVPE